MTTERQNNFKEKEHNYKYRDKKLLECNKKNTVMQIIYTMGTKSRKSIIR